MSDQRDTIIDAFLTLLTDRPLEEVTVRAIAEEAGISLAVLNQHFASRGHIIEAYARRIDQAMLDADVSDMTGEPGRERLFDVLMSRLDAIRPHRAAVSALFRAARRDPAVGLGLNAISVRSAVWMLAAAGIAPAPGWRGRTALQDLALRFARVLRVFVMEDDPGMPRTMAALDKELREAERRHHRFSRLFGNAVRDDPTVRRPPVTDSDPWGEADRPAFTTAGPAAAGAEGEPLADPADVIVPPDGLVEADALDTGGAESLARDNSLSASVDLSSTDGATTEEDTLRND